MIGDSLKTSAYAAFAEGVHNLFAVFRGGGASGLGNLNWFRFR